MSESELSDNFSRIAELHGPERDEALRRLAASDSDQAAEIASLLRHEPVARDDEDASVIETFAPPLDPDNTSSRIRIPGFKILETLAFGGQSIVYLAEQLHPRRLVAIKILGGGMTDDRARDRFVAEAELQGTIRHPAIVGIHACGVEVEDGRSMPWIAMELVPEARTVIEAAETDDWSRDRRLQALATVADAIHAAHLRGVVHRDLKPGNVLVGAAGRVRIIDFGIARLLDAADRESVTREGELLGTIRYLAPEQLSGSDIDARADIYSLGVLACQLLHGVSPYGERGTTASIIAAIQSNSIEIPEARNRIERDINAVLARTMSLSPRGRYESMAALARDLRSLAAGRRVDARIATKPEEFRRFASRNPLPLGLTALLFIAIVVGLIANARLLQSARDFDRSANQARLQADLGLASAALLQGDESVARKVLSEADPRTRSFSLEMLESAALSRHIPFGDFGDRSNLYAMRSIPGTRGVFVAGSSAFGILDSTTGSTITFDAALPGVEDLEGSEMITVDVDPGSSPERFRAAVGTTGGRVLLVEATSGADGDDSTMTNTITAAIDTAGSRTIDAAYLSPGRLVHGHGPTSLRVVSVDARGEPTVERVLDVDDEITVVDAIDDRWLLLGNRRGRLRRVDLETGTRGPEIDVGLRRPIDRIVLDETRERAIVIARRKAVMVDLGSAADGDVPREEVRVLTLEGVGDRIWDAAFGPRGEVLALTGRDGHVRFFEAADGTEIGRLPDLDGCAWSMVWSEEAILVSTESNGIVRYDTLDLPMTERGRRVLGFSPSGRVELHARDHEWRIFGEGRPHSGAWIPSPAGEILAASVKDPVPSSTEMLIAVAAVADVGMIGIDKADRMRRLLRPEAVLGIESLVLARDGRTVFWIDRDRTTWRARLETNGTFAPERLELPFHDREHGRLDGSRSSHAFSLIRPARLLEGSDVLIGTSNGVLLRPDEDALPARVAAAEIGWLLSFTEATDGSGDWFGGGHNGHVIRHANGSIPSDVVWSRQSRRTGIVGLAAHPDGLHLVVLGSDGTIDIVDARSGDRICTLGPVPGEPVAVRIDKGGRHLKVHARDGSVSRWGIPAEGRRIVVPAGGD